MTTPTKYPYPPARGYRLLRDDEIVMVGTEQECWAWLHRRHSFSVEHALRHEGYRMEPVGEKGGDDDPR